MDVKCENCGTEYDFDDAKVTAAGITVKCTHCGHLFRVARPASVAPQSRDTREDPPSARARHWMVRNRHGEIREFRDLTTLQQWIVERRVSVDDEISKTGESWKPLGSIAELARFFQAAAPSEEAVTLELMVGSDPLDRLIPAAPASPFVPPFGLEEVMPTGRFRLEGPQPPPPDPEVAAPTVPKPSHPVASVSRVDVGRRKSVAPMPSQALDTNPTVPVTRPLPHPAVQVRRTPHPPEGHSPRLPVAPAALGRPFPSAGAPTPAHRDEGAHRGFIMGVLATVALAGLAYFVYHQVVRPDGPAAGPQVGRRASSELYLAIERAEADYDKDTETSFARADAGFIEVIRLLGSPPQDKALAVRAHLGRARIAMALAEYRKLEDGDPSPLLAAAEANLADARQVDESEPGVALGYADFYRIQGSRQRANKFLAKVEAAGVDSDEANLVRAAVSVHNGDWGAAQARLGKLPPSALDRPRARYLLAVSLARSGRTQEAVFELTRLLARHTDHGPARRLLARLGSGPLAPPPGDAPVDPELGVAPAAPATVSPAPVALAPVAPTAPATVAPAAPATVAPLAPPSAVRVAPPSRAAVPSAAPPTVARPVAPATGARPAVPAGFDGLMDRARKAQESGRNGEARRLLLQALSGRPDHPEALASLGWCDVDDGDFPRAASYFRRALTAYAGYSDARYGLAVALERSGQTAEAVRAYEEYLTRHTDGRRAVVVRERIKKLKGG